MKNQFIELKNVNMSETLRYLGLRENNLNPNIKELLLLCEKELLEHARPMYTYKVFELDEEGQPKGCDFTLQGEDIKKHLSGCSRVVLMCVTLSAYVDRLIRIKQINGMADAMIIDSMASAMVEQVCDKVEDIIRDEFQGYELTWRFGLGYGDFPLEGQKHFLNVLDAPKKIGVCVSESCLLTPSKSVTCVIGMGKNIANTGKKSCANCNFNDRCLYRIRGEKCGS